MLKWQKILYIQIFCSFLQIFLSRHFSEILKFSQINEITIPLASLGFQDSKMVSFKVLGPIINILCPKIKKKILTFSADFPMLFAYMLCDLQGKMYYIFQHIF